jgi:hypothetical protein
MLLASAMARPLRVEFDGALYHVTSRGNARADIFEDDHDDTPFLIPWGRSCSGVTGYATATA